MSKGASIELGHVGIPVGDAHIVSKVTLDIRPGEFVCLLGPGGCGKSALLNVIADFLPVAGVVSVGGGDRVEKTGLDRVVALQSAEVLFPWITIRENLEYGLRLAGDPKAERRAKADRFIAMVGLGHAAERFPKELSVGMRRRADRPGADRRAFRGADGRALRRARRPDPRGAAA